MGGRQDGVVVVVAGGASVRNFAVRVLAKGARTDG